MKNRADSWKPPSRRNLAIAASRPLGETLQDSGAGPAGFPIARPSGPAHFRGLDAKDRSPDLWAGRVAQARARRPGPGTDRGAASAPGRAGRGSPVDHDVRGRRLIKKASAASASTSPATTISAPAPGAESGSTREVVAAAWGGVPKGTKRTWAAEFRARS